MAAPRLTPRRHVRSVDAVAPACLRQDGTSLVELIFALGVAATVCGIAVATVAGAVSDARANAAARSLAARLQRARLEAVLRNRHVGLRVTHTSVSDLLTAYEDGDDDGVLSADIVSGIDRPFDAPFALRDQFPGVTFGALPALPAADPASTPPGSDPVRLGVSDTAVFTPHGTATAGTLYLLGTGGQQYAVRIFGETGRTRVLRFNAATWTWQTTGS